MAKISMKELAELVSRATTRRLWSHGRGCFDVERMAYLLASHDSARFFVDEMPNARNLVNRIPLLDFALDQCTVEGMTCEFGVGPQATSLRHIADKVDGAVHGFDSFEGLPED